MAKAAARNEAVESLDVTTVNNAGLPAELEDYSGYEDFD